MIHQDRWQSDINLRPIQPTDYNYICLGLLSGLSHQHIEKEGVKAHSAMVELALMAHGSRKLYVHDLPGHQAFLHTIRDWGAKNAALLEIGQRPRPASANSNAVHSDWSFSMTRQSRDCYARANRYSDLEPDI